MISLEAEVELFRHIHGQGVAQQPGENFH